MTAVLQLIGGLHRVVPVSLAGARRSLANAHRGVAEIASAVAERRTLALALVEPLIPGDLAGLDVEECWTLLAQSTIGRLAYVARAGVPDIVPVNYAVHKDRLLVRTAIGPKLQAAQRRDTVALEVDRLDEEGHYGWSVVVIARSHVAPPESGRMPGGPVPWANGQRQHTIVLEPVRITGRRLL